MAINLANIQRKIGPYFSLISEGPAITLCWGQVSVVGWLPHSSCSCHQMTSSPNPLSLLRKDCLSSGDEKRLSLMRVGFLRSVHILRPSNSHSSQFSLALLQIDIFNRETYDREFDKNYKCTVLAQLAQKKVFCSFSSRCKAACFAPSCLLVPCGVALPRKPQM